MRENRKSESVWGAPGNGRSYRARPHKLCPILALPVDGAGSGFVVSVPMSFSNLIMAWLTIPIIGFKCAISVSADNVVIRTYCECDMNWL